MQEKLLHTIWQYSLYNSVGLKTIDGEPVTVIFPGRLNSNAGPDFLEAKVKIGKTLLAGHVEMHVNSSDWDKHGHTSDPAYKNVILHVVYTYDSSSGPANVPVLCIAPCIAKEIILRYNYLAYAKTTVPCASRLDKVKPITKYAWLTRMLAERWEEKQSGWQQLLQEASGDWSTLLYWKLAANFGFKINSDAFLALARSLPLTVLAKHRENLLQIEALLFGQAGMLSGEVEGVYPNALKTEYTYLAHKYQLEPILLHSWKYLRLRPANFPAVRIAQFAALVHRSVHLFATVVSRNSISDILPLFDVTASHYWETHHNFGEESGKPGKKRLGKVSVHNIIINTVAPLTYLYARQHGTEQQQEAALKMLDDLNPEINHITEMWEKAAWPSENASQSQAHIQLYNNYCSKKRCLDCAIGLSLVKS